MVIAYIVATTKKSDLPVKDKVFAVCKMRNIPIGTYTSQFDFFIS